MEILVPRHNCSSNGSRNWGLVTYYMITRKPWALFSPKHACFETDQRFRRSLVGGLEHGFYFPFHIWDVILPIDELHHFSRWLKHVKTTNQLQMTTCQEPATGLKSSKTPKRACRNRPNPRPILYFMFLINGKPGKPTQRGNLEGIVSMASARSTPSTPYFARDIWSLAHISSICNGGDRPDTFSCSSSL